MFGTIARGTILIDDNLKMIGFFLGHIGRTLKNKLTKAFTDDGLDMTAEQFSILMYLWKRQGINQQELSDGIFKEKTAIVRLIDHLEKSNLIKRVRDGNDRRNNLIFLTDEGISLKDSLVKIVDKTIQQAVTGLKEEEITLLGDILKRVYYNIEPECGNIEFLNTFGENIEKQKRNSAIASDVNS